MTVYFASAVEPKEGLLLAISHGPFVSREDALAFLQQSATPGRWTVYGPDGAERFDVPPRVVTPVSA